MVVRLRNTVPHNGVALEWTESVVVTGSRDAWNNIITIPLGPHTGSSAIAARIVAEVEGATVLISLADADGNTILCAEQAIEPGEVRVVDLIAPGDSAGSVLVRTDEGAQAAPSVTIHSVTCTPQSGAHAALRARDFGADRWDRLPRQRPSPLTPGQGGRHERLIAVTHTSRDWNQETCTREFLGRRFAGDRRADTLPRFADLTAAGTRSYAGGVSVLRVGIEDSTADIQMLGHAASDDKIAAANVVGQTLVLCLEDRLLVLPWSDAAALGDRGAIQDALEAPPRTIIDPWFAGLHTIVPVDRSTALVSASGPDAVLWVDIPSGRVTRRWRLPSDLYGTNYEITATSSVHDHYIHNDLQLGHLNSATPLGRDQAIITTLGQGDVGIVDADGGYRRIHHGSIGCHGVRVDSRGRVYLSDSTSGQLRMLVPRAAGEKWAWATSVWNGETRWLHDALEVAPDHFMLAHGDRNMLSIVDIAQRRELGRWLFSDYGANVQFLTDLGESVRDIERPSAVAVSEALGMHEGMDD